METRRALLLIADIGGYTEYMKSHRTLLAHAARLSIFLATGTGLAPIHAMLESASPKQLAEILFNELQIPVTKKTATGIPSTAEEVLQDLAQDYELPRVLLEYRGLAKLKSTYTDKLAHMADPRTGRVHTSYHQAVAATGRLSCSVIPAKNACN